MIRRQRILPESFPVDSIDPTCGTIFTISGHFPTCHAALTSAPILLIEDKMTVQPIDTLMAYKAINLATELSNSEKRVAGAIIDHFNRRTNQCDPSLDCIAELIGMSRRTVIRATNRLQRLGFIRRIRHGGYYHRNKYEPVWSRFIQVEADWKARRSAPRARFGAAKVSPCKGQSRHVGGDVADPQTCSSNQSKQTYDAALPPPRPDASGSLNEKKGSPKESNPRVNARNQSSRPILRIASSDMAARDAAERRWNKELLDQYRSEHLVYGRIVDAIDVKLSRSTTDAELRQRGSGLNYLINELFARDAAFRETSRGSIRSGSQDSKDECRSYPGGRLNCEAIGDGPVD